MNPQTYSAIVYVRTVPAYLLPPEEAEKTNVDKLHEIRTFLEKKPDILYSNTISDSRVGYYNQESLPGFSRLLTLLEAHNYTALVLYSVEQFAATPQENRHCLLTLLPRLGIRILSVHENYDSLASGDDQKGYPVLSKLADTAEVHELARQKNARYVDKLQHGKSIYSRCPYGYLPGPENTGTLLRDPETAPVVERIFREYLSGKAIHEIAKALTAESVPTPMMMKAAHGYRYKSRSISTYWSQTTLNRILRNSVYVGDWVFGNSRKSKYMSSEDALLEKGSPVPILRDHHEAFISRDTFSQVQIMLDADKMDTPPRRAKERTDPPNPYFNLLHCSVCGANMLYQQRVFTNHIPKRIYICSNGWHKGPEVCSRHTTLFSQVDAEIRAAVQAEIDQADALTERIEAGQYASSADAEGNYRQQMDTLLGEIRKITMELSRLHADFAAGSVIPEDYYLRKEELDTSSRGKSRMLKEAMTLLREYRSVFTLDGNPWLKLYHGRTLPEQMALDVSKELIDNILLSPEGKVTVTLKHGDRKQQLLDSLELLGETEQKTEA